METTQNNKAILALVTCPICMELPRHFKLYMCPNSHTICSECKNKSQKCPYCRHGNTNIRNRIAEEILRTTTKDMEIKCKFQCGKTANLENISTHEEICTETTQQCSNEQCKWEGQQADLIKHTKQTGCTTIAQVIYNAEGTKAFIRTSLKMNNENMTENKRKFKQKWTPLYFTPLTILLTQWGNTKATITLQREKGQWHFRMKANTKGKLHTMTYKISIKGKEDEQPTINYQATTNNKSHSIIMSQATINNLKPNNNEDTILRCAIDFEINRDTKEWLENHK